MLLGDIKIAPFEVLSGKDRKFPVCSICSFVFSRNITSECNRGGPAKIGLRPAGPGYRFPADYQWN
jgi:hypothetical protein